MDEGVTDGWRDGWMKSTFNDVHSIAIKQIQCSQVVPLTMFIPLEYNAYNAHDLAYPDQVNSGKRKLSLRHPQEPLGRVLGRCLWLVAVH